MDNHVVIGTAGHVDHGKTALVKALTGVDADRWEEEKRRGITIDLGFAKLDMGDGVTASVVDVPGHEDFVRNMVAGATGIDVVLLVIAADEGVMPQTHEHLAILEFLGVSVGVLAITKCDLVDEDWLELVEEDVKEKLSQSTIAWTDNLVRVSSVTGLGIDRLRELLRIQAGASKKRTEHDLFRLPVDRVFSVPGAGTVVTGTAWSGSVKVGDEVRVLPREKKARVRGIEVHDLSVESALPGRRTALALVGLNKSDVERGHTVVADSSWRSTTSVDAVVTLLPGARPITQRSRLRFHLGTSEVMTRLTPAGQEIIGGGEGEVRFRLEAPVVCRWGDKGVIRSYSPMTTIGGCVVVDPFPNYRPRRPKNLSARLEQNPSERLKAFVENAGEDGLTLNEVPVRIGVLKEEVSGLMEALNGYQKAGNRLYSADVVQTACKTTLKAVGNYHKKNKLAPGMPRDILRQVLTAEKPFVESIHEQLEDRGELVFSGQLARLPEFEVELSEKQQRWVKALRDELEASRSKGRTIKELSESIEADAIEELLAIGVGEGTTVRVGKDRYYSKEQLDRLIDTVLEEIGRLGRVTPADLREKTGLSRKYLIPLLEWMDGRSLTLRQGDARTLGSSASDH